jgi:hypothetical protein
VRTMQSGMKLRSMSSSKERFCARRRWSSNTSPVLGLFGSLIAMTVHLDLTHRLDAASLSPPAGSVGYPGPGVTNPEQPGEVADAERGTEILVEPMGRYADGSPIETRAKGRPADPLRAEHQTDVNGRRVRQELQIGLSRTSRWDRLSRWRVGVPRSRFRIARRPRGCIGMR